MASTPDFFFDLKNAFYLGNWQQCLNDAQKVKPASEAQKLVRDVFMYRAFIAQKKFGVVSSEIQDLSHEPFKALKLLVKYLTNSGAEKSKIVDELEETIELDNIDSFSSIFAATIYFYEQNYESALKYLHKSNNIECLALSLQVYLKLDRLDLARKAYKRMCEVDEYCTLSQLSQAWMNLYYAGEKLQDAYFIFQELKEKFGPTPLLLTGQACCLICQGRYEEAEPLINQSIEKDPNYIEAVINQMVLAQFSGKSSEVINRYINQLKDDGTLDNAFLKDFSAKEREFDRIALQYQV